MFRSQGGKGNLKQAQTLAKAALDARAGKRFGKNTTAYRFLVLLRQLREHKFTGDPRRDWIHARESLRNAGAGPLSDVAAHSDQLIAFQRGRRINSSFAELWQNHRCYLKARATFDVVMAEEQLLLSGSEFDGLHVMTIHKSKGKEFDAVMRLVGVLLGPFCELGSEQIQDAIPSGLQIRLRHARLAFRTFNVVRDKSFREQVIRGND